MEACNLAQALLIKKNNKIFPALPSVYHLVEVGLELFISISMIPGTCMFSLAINVNSGGEIHPQIVP